MDIARSEDVVSLPVLLAHPSLALSIVSHLPEGLLLVDVRLHDYPIVYCNSAFFELTGCRIDEVLGLPCLDCFQSLADADLVNNIEQHFRSTRPAKTEFISHCKRGTINRCELSLTPVYGNLGQASHMLMLFRASASWLTS